MAHTSNEGSRLLMVNRCIVLNDERQFLIAKRGPRNSYNPDLWEFLGGKSDPEESPEDCLMRELREECGLLVRLLHPLTLIHERLITSGKYEGYIHRTHTAIGVVAGGSFRLSSEHCDSVWTNYEHFLGFPLTPVAVITAALFQEYLSSL